MGRPNPINRPIRVLGAGPAGLTAAINLAKAGFSVEVFERNGDCGTRFGGDLQGLENWSEKGNVVEDFNRMGIKTSFDCHPFLKATITEGTTLAKIKSAEPFFYLVKRGTFKGSLPNSFSIHKSKVRPHFPPF